MKKVFLLVTVLSLLTACKKDPTQPIIQKSNGTPMPKGNPIGIATTKTIGSTGGSITSADNGVTVIIPAGAVSTNTEFSIQPITNTAPNGIGASYLLLPEGKHFDKPVSIQFKYTDDQIEGTYAQALFIAYQDTTGIWNATGMPQVDTVNKTVTVLSQHFSRWAEFANTILFVDKPSIDVNEYTNLSVRKIMTKQSSGDDVLAALALPGGYIPLGLPIDDDYLSNWSVPQGSGQLVPHGTYATYQAPPSAPSPNPVTISVVVTNEVAPLNSPLHSITLRRKVYVNASYFEIVLDGNTNIYPNAFAYTASGYTTITAGNTAGNGGSFQFEGLANGSYDFGGLTMGGASVNLKVGGMELKDYYFDCNGNPHQLNGTLTISKWSSVGSYIEGDFSGSAATQSTSCGAQIKTIKGRFRAKRMS